MRNYCDRREHQEAAHEAAVELSCFLVSQARERAGATINIVYHLNTSFYLDPQVHLARSNHTHRFFAVAKNTTTFFAGRTGRIPEAG